MPSMLCARYVSHQKPKKVRHESEGRIKTERALRRRQVLRCGSTESTNTLQRFKNGTKHLRLQCARCGKFFGFESQTPEVKRENIPQYDPSARPNRRRRSWANKAARFWLAAVEKLFDLSEGNLSAEDVVLSVEQEKPTRKRIEAFSGKYRRLFDAHREWLEEHRQAAGAPVVAAPTSVVASRSSEVEL